MMSSLVLQEPLAKAGNECDPFHIGQPGQLIKMNVYLKACQPVVDAFNHLMKSLNNYTEILNYKGQENERTFLGNIEPGLISKVSAGNDIHGMDVLHFEPTGHSNNSVSAFEEAPVIWPGKQVNDSHILTEGSDGLQQDLWFNVFKVTLPIVVMLLVFAIILLQVVRLLQVSKAML